jgi:hypothetical protein
LPHRDYNHYLKDLEVTFKCDFPDIESGATDNGKIGSETKIPQTTLYHWYRSWKECPKWRPWRVKKVTII